MNNKNPDRYQVPDEEDHEPGSNNTVLKNFLSIKHLEKIHEAEEIELARTTLEAIEIFDKDHQFSTSDLINLHELWLGDIYPSAGKFRTVSMSKGGFLFAAPNRIEALMQQFERNALAKYTPCQNTTLNELAEGIGITHVEFVIIHPFREGNGRTARLLADLMALQAGKPPINFSPIDQLDNIKGFERYIAAIHAGVDCDYAPIKNLFMELLENNTEKR